MNTTLLILLFAVVLSVIGFSIFQYVRIYHRTKLELCGVLTAISSLCMIIASIIYGCVLFQIGIFVALADVITSPRHAPEFAPIFSILFTLGFVFASMYGHYIAYGELR